MVDNSPFFAHGLSWKDIVEGFDNGNGTLFLTRVVEKSGHRTVRVAFEEDTERSRSILKQLNNLGATYEGANPKYLAIDIPPEADFAAIIQYLTDEEVTWEHADPTYEQLYGE